MGGYCSVFPCGFHPGGMTERSRWSGVARTTGSSANISRILEGCQNGRHGLPTPRLPCPVLCLPFREDMTTDNGSGGVATLNPRLLSGIPPACIQDQNTNRNNQSPALYGFSPRVAWLSGCLARLLSGIPPACIQDQNSNRNNQSPALYGFSPRVAWLSGCLANRKNDDKNPGFGHGDETGLQAMRTRSAPATPTATEAHNMKIQRSGLGGGPNGLLSSAIRVPIGSRIATSDTPQATSDKRTSPMPAVMEKRLSGGGWCMCTRNEPGDDRAGDVNAEK